MTSHTIVSLVSHTCSAKADFPLLKVETPFRCLSASVSLNLSQSLLDWASTHLQHLVTVGWVYSVEQPQLQAQENCSPVEVFIIKHMSKVYDLQNITCAKIWNTTIL